jgi:hypothetical protein
MTDLLEQEQSHQRFRLASLLRSTEEVLHCAQIGDWESVETMEKQRQAELVACFSGDNAEASPLIAEALATLLYMNNQIADLVKQAKAELVLEQQRMESQKSAANQYQDLV